MTNKYQEALDDEMLNDIHHVNRQTIREALQAGAEGRILPRLDGYSPNQLEWCYSDEGVFCAFKAFDNKKSWKELNRFEDYIFGEGETPAEAIQNAIDKIGRCSKCGVRGEEYFDWSGNCLVCEDEDDTR